MKAVQLRLPTGLPFQKMFKTIEKVHDIVLNDQTVKVSEIAETHVDACRIF